MKRTRFTAWLLIVVALSFAATACRKNPNNVQVIPGEPRTGPHDFGPGQPFPPEPPTVTDTNITPLVQVDRTNWQENPEIFKAYSVHFDFDSAALKSAERSKMSSVAEYLKGNPQAAVRVEGNCDERGTEEYNRSLGERRALASREELLRLGIEPARVDTKSWGEDNPANNPGHDESAWKQNRRDDFVLLTPPPQ